MTPCPPVRQQKKPHGLVRLDKNDKIVYYFCTAGGTPVGERRRMEKGAFDRKTSPRCQGHHAHRTNTTIQQTRGQTGRSLWSCENKKSTLAAAPRCGVVNHCPPGRLSISPSDGTLHFACLQALRTYVRPTNATVDRQTQFLQVRQKRPPSLAVRVAHLIARLGTLSTYDAASRHRLRPPFSLRPAPEASP